MLDVFVVTLLAGLVHLSMLAIIKPGLGVSPLAAAAVLTTFTTRYFDPRRTQNVIDEPDPEETDV